MEHITRRYEQQVAWMLKKTPCVVVTGARQIGKSTLAQRLTTKFSSHFYDLEKSRDLQAMQNAHDELDRHKGKLVVIDEAQIMPELFAALRVLIDERRREGLRFGQFLLLGSADERLMDQASESLAGRCIRVQLPGIDCLEAGFDRMRLLWERGGYPESFLAASDDDSRVWRAEYVENQIRRELPAMAIGVANRQAMMSAWQLIAATGIGSINESSLARKLQVSAPTVSRYLKILEEIFLIRRLPAYSTNLGKKVVKSPRYYVRDSGLAQVMNNQDIWDADPDQAGLSWQAFATENIISVLPVLWRPFYYRSHQKGEIDLILENRGKLWAIEIKLKAPGSLPAGMARSLAALNPERSFIVHSESECRRLRSGVEIISLPAIMQQLLQATADHRSRGRDG